MRRTDCVGGLTKCLAVTPLLLLCGCWARMEYVQLEYLGAGGPSTLSISTDKHVPVAVRVSDERGPDKRLISKTGPYGSEAAPIYASNDVPQLIQRAFDTELTKRGFVTAPDGAMVSVELVRFRGESRPNWSYGHTVKADMILSVAVRRPDGMVVFSHTYTGNGSDDAGPQGVEVVKVAFEQALTAAITAAVNDKAFVESLLAASRTESN